MCATVLSRVASITEHMTSACCLPEELRLQVCSVARVREDYHMCRRELCTTARVREDYHMCGNSFRSCNVSEKSVQLRLIWISNVILTDSVLVCEGGNETMENI